jgi:S-formylglutathione hydrolase FrmB
MIRYVRILIPTIVLMWVMVANAQQLLVRFPSKVLNEKISGKLYVFMSKTDHEPLNSVNFPLPVATTVMDISNLPADSIVILDLNAQSSYPVPFKQLEKGRYYAQAIFDRSHGFGIERTLSDRVGNLYSAPMQLLLEDNVDSTYSLVCNQLVREKEFGETTHTKRIKFRSTALSRFHDKDIFMNGALILPDTLLKNPSARLPIYIYIAGFGSSYLRFNGSDEAASVFTNDPRFIFLFLDGNSSNGHTAYANSDNNGPWGDALVKELIPAIEKQCHCNGYRYVHGHSSGGWSALYLQVMYPDFFQQCWASSPDSYDFRDFSGINIYEAGANVFYGKDDNLRPSALIGGEIPIAYVKTKADWEYLVPGEQFNSFNAVFSGKDTSGTYRQLWNPRTGTIDPVVAKEWRRFDLAFHIETHWKDLAGKIADKIFISVGEYDNFLLQGANRLFQKTIRDNKMKIRLGFYSGDHFTVTSDEKLQHDAKQYLNDNYSTWEQKYKVSVNSR